MQFLLTFSINKYDILMVFWNIFLALIPCVVVYYLALSVKSKKWNSIKNGQRVSFILIFLFWFFMFPNTAYLFSIPRHIVDYCSDYNKYHVCLDYSRTWMVFFFFFYSLIGIPTFYYALNKMKLIFGYLFGGTVSSLFPIIMIPVTSVGVMFGLFQRFNSWDVILNPVQLLQTSTGYISDVNLFFTFIFFTVMLYAVYYGFGIFIKKMRND